MDNQSRLQVTIIAGFTEDSLDSDLQIPVRNLMVVLENGTRRQSLRRLSGIVHPSGGFLLDGPSIERVKQSLKEIGVNPDDFVTVDNAVDSERRKARTN